MPECAPGAVPSPEAPLAERATVSPANGADGGPPKRTRRRWVKRPSPAAVLARLVTDRADAKASSPVQVLAAAVDRNASRRPPASDGSAFWKAWLAHRRDLQRYCLRLSGGNLAEAEDALSEAMLKGVASFSPAVVRNHRAWLVRLVHNACMDRHRNGRRESRLAGALGIDGAAIAAIVPAQSRSPEECLAGCELITGLQEAMRALPPLLAEPLRLFLDDLSDGEIADRLSITRDVVRKRRQMARDWLRRNIPA